jgi:uncharacterized protein YggU (UPF0235/DUF167 family)
MTRKFEITDARRGAAIAVRVITRAERNEVAGFQDDNAVKVRLTASPAESNSALLAFLAERLGVPQTSLEIVAGAEKPDKVVSISGITAEEAEARLQADDQ